MKLSSFVIKWACVFLAAGVLSAPANSNDGNAVALTTGTIIPSAAITQNGKTEEVPNAVTANVSEKASPIVTTTTASILLTTATTETLLIKTNRTETTPIEETITTSTISITTTTTFILPTTTTTETTLMPTTTTKTLLIPITTTTTATTTSPISTTTTKERPTKERPKPEDHKHPLPDLDIQPGLKPSPVNPKDKTIKLPVPGLDTDPDLPKSSGWMLYGVCLVVSAITLGSLMYILHRRRTRPAVATQTFALLSQQDEDDSDLDDNVLFRL